MTDSNSIQIVETENAPPAIGPYSQAVAAGDFLFISGQIPLDPKTGEIVADDISLQTERVLKNIIAILEKKNVGIDRVVKVEVFLTNMNDFAVMNELYAKYFDQDIKPARYVVQVGKLPKNVKIEISCTAYIG